MKHWLRRLSLKRAVVTGIALGVILPAAVALPLLAVDTYRRETDERIRAMLEQYATMLSQSVAAPLWQADASAARPFAESVMLNPDVISISIEDATLGEFLVLKSKARSEGQLLRDARPVVYDGQTIGKVIIEMTTADLERQLLWDFSKAAILLLIQILVSVTFLVALFDRRVIRPLNRLQGDLKRLSEGDLGIKVSADRDDEIGELAAGVDHMRERLNEKIAEAGELNTSLERRVSERTQALHAANAELTEAMSQLKNARHEIERSDRMAALGALVAGVAHELNTPIGNSVTVASTLHDLTRQFREQVDAGLTRNTLQGYVDNAEHASDMLMRNLSNAAELIGSFKQVAVDRTNAQRRGFMLDEVIGETLLTMGPALKPKQVTVRIDVPEGIEMTSYPGQLGQVLSNLVNNAVLHGLESTACGEIRVSARELEGNRVEICVSDNGSGIDEDNLRRIFDPFFTTKMGRGGTGLGLNIVHNLVTDVLGGSVRVESRVGHGSRFHVVIPRHAPKSGGAPA